MLAGGEVLEAVPLVFICYPTLEELELKLLRLKSGEGGGSLCAHPPGWLPFNLAIACPYTPGA